MRKLTAIIITILILISVIPIPAIALTPIYYEPIKTAEDFMAMEGGRNYRLESDITLSSTLPGKYWGSFDGGGHTVTVSAPLFEDFSGNVKNLTIEGAVTLHDSDGAAFAIKSAEGFSMANCVNNTSVTVTGNAKRAGGFLATSEAALSTVIFRDCVNNARIHIDSTFEANVYAGGLAADALSAVLHNCTNNGEIYNRSHNPIAGGMVGRVARIKGENLAEAYSCVNNGKVISEENYIHPDGTKSGAGDAGGIFGHIGCSGNTALYKVYSCVNNGDIVSSYRVGGLVGYVYASQAMAYIEVLFSINTGDITYGRVSPTDGSKMIHDYASPFVSYSNSGYTTVKYCINTGDIHIRENAVTENKGGVFIGSSSAYDFSNLNCIFLTNKDQFKYLSYNPPYSSVIGRFLMAEAEGIYDTTLEALASGEVCQKIMQAYEEDLRTATDLPADLGFYQRLGEDVLPSADPSRGYVLLENGKYVNGERPALPEPETTPVPEPETTPVPETTAVETKPAETEPPETSSPETTRKDDIFGLEGVGCAGAVTLCVPMLMLGAVMIIKKKK